MLHIDLNKNWEFQMGEPSNIPMMPTEKKIISLPYDFMIAGDVEKDAISGSGSGFYKGGTASYTKYIEISAEEKELIHILSFDGCYGITKIVVNGHVAARHHYGYTPFTVNIDSYLKVGRNRITVTASNSNEPNGRWYTGAGLYRKVSLLIAPKVHVIPDGLYVYTRSVKEGKAEIVVEASVKNETKERRTMEFTMEIMERTGGKLAAKSQNLVTIAPGETVVVISEVSITDPKIWDIDSPEMYDVKVHTDAQGSCDVESTAFGIRTITIDAENGLRLNGKSLNLKGGCIHHDNGIVGAAAFRDSEYRKVKLHKDAGFNALRFAHNPPSRDMLNACDELGMLVIDEAFDVWNMEKNYHDFSNFFEAEWQQELANMIVRDRNHPSIFMWSIGNEIVEQGGLSDGYVTSARLTAFTRTLDHTRAIGGALCSFFHGLDDEDNNRYWQSVMTDAAKLQENGMVNLDCEFGKKIWDSYTAPFVKNWDVVGYNYLQYQYEPSHEKHPERVICCTESKPRELASYWADVERLPYVIGDFEWTSMDYIGEAGIGTSFYVEEEQVPMMRQAMFRAQYPVRTAEAGDFDICGFTKPQLGYRKAVWGSDETCIVTYNPVHAGKVELLGRYGWGDCDRSWSWPVEDGTRIKVEVYSRAEEVELWVNGKSLGRKPAGKEHDFRAVWETEYVRGEVSAVSYDTEGKEISRDSIKSAGEPVKVVVKEDETLAVLRKTRLVPMDVESVNYLVIEVVDADGNLVPYAQETITAEFSEGAELIALGSGRVSTEENYTRGEITTYRGRALAVVRGGAGTEVICCKIKK
ncbi:MAG: glycoside hydrolase family 2 TIM barrel-domain containing protein [Oliverpabstia sp.]